MANNYDTIIQYARSLYNELGIYEHRGQLSLTLSKEALIDVCFGLRDNPETSFDMLTDITAIDWLGKKKPRFEVVYFLYSNKLKTGIRLKVPLSDNEPSCPSVVSVWESANWYERETYDMYGVIFENHPNLRRFYMQEDFFDPETSEPLYPLRKDFPLMGIPGSLSLPPYPEKYGEVK
jgi:NADH-quinone oxidoreductase subunit C